MQLKDIDKYKGQSALWSGIFFGRTLLLKLSIVFTERIPRQRHGFEQAGRGECFSVFDNYSEYQRREDFLEILKCKKEYLENLIRDLADRTIDPDPEASAEINEFGLPPKKDYYSEEISRTRDASPLDQAVYEIISKIKDPALLKEARLNLIALRDELLKPKPSWAKLKRNMIWLIEFGKEEFFSILPFIVLYIRKISD